MRTIGLYFLAGLFVGAMLNVVVPIASADWTIRGLPAGTIINDTTSMSIQVVNRNTKSDRLGITEHKNERVQNKKPRSPVLVGCDGAFSPLSASASRFNYSSRCLT